MDSCATYFVFFIQEIDPYKDNITFISSYTFREREIYLGKSKAPPFLSWVTRLLKFAAIADVVICGSFSALQPPLFIDRKDHHATSSKIRKQADGVWGVGGVFTSKE